MTNFRAYCCIIIANLRVVFDQVREIYYYFYYYYLLLFSASKASYSSDEEILTRCRLCINICTDLNRQNTLRVPVLTATERYVFYYTQELRCVKAATLAYTVVDVFRPTAVLKLNFILIHSAQKFRTGFAAFNVY